MSTDPIGRGDPPERRSGPPRQTARPLDEIGTATTQLDRFHHPTLTAVPSRPALPLASSTSRRVVSRSGRVRWVILADCMHCSQRHAHAAPLNFLAGVRRAACGRGSYRLAVGG